MRMGSGSVAGWFGLDRRLLQVGRKAVWPSEIASGRCRRRRGQRGVGRVDGGWCLPRAARLLRPSLL